MQVDKKESTSVATVYSVIISPEEIDRDVDVLIAEKAATVRVDGFRVGKAPADLIKKRYLDSARQTAIEESMKKAFNVVKEEVGEAPRLLRPYCRNFSYTPEDGISADIVVERLPEIEPVNMDDVVVEKIVCDITQEEIDRAFERLQRDFKAPAPIDGPACAGDSATIKIHLFVGGELQPDAFRDSLIVRVGKDNTPGLSGDITSRLEGACVSDEFEIPWSEPNRKKAAHKRRKHQQDQLNAIVKVKVLQLERNTLTPMTDEDLKKYGISSVDAFKTTVANRMRRYRELQLMACSKRSLLDELDRLCTFDVPESLVADDFDRIWPQVKNELVHAREIDDEDVRGKTDEEVEAEYRELSRRRIRLGLALSAFAEQQKLQMSASDLDRIIVGKCIAFPYLAQEFVDFYGQDAEHFKVLQVETSEDLLIRRALELCKTVEKQVTQDELLTMLEDILPDDALVTLVHAFKREFVPKERSNIDEEEYAKSLHLSRELAAALADALYFEGKGDGNAAKDATLGVDDGADKGNEDKGADEVNENKGASEDDNANGECVVSDANAEDVTPDADAAN
ncbi:MAG: trigger factor [Holosporales bacterium]|jgi:trigger factor|nr:trigger factor [Holosporales bacterium]